MNTKLLRQKILDLAIRGKLTEQKKSDGTTRELLARISETKDERRETREFVKSSPASLNMSSPAPTGNLAASSVKKKNAKSKNLAKEIIPLDKSEAPFEIPENWEWVRLGDIASCITDGDHQAPPQRESGIPFIVISNVSESGIDFSTTKFVDAEYYNSLDDKRRPKVDDILFTVTGSYGRVVVVKDPRDFCFQRHIALIRTFVNPDFMRYVLSSQYIKQVCDEVATGIAQKTVGLKAISLFSIPLPPLAEQQRIVEAIENAFAEITAIENNQELLKKHIKQGRQKILNLAIRGKLTQQLKTDGTTQDLLKQIQDERTGEALQTRDERKSESSTCHPEQAKRVEGSSIVKRENETYSPNVILSNASSCHSERSAKGAKSKNLAKEIIPLDNSEAPFEIPENWEWVKYSDVVVSVSTKEFRGYMTLVFVVSHHLARIDVRKSVFTQNAQKSYKLM